MKRRKEYTLEVKVRKNFGIVKIGFFITTRFVQDRKRQRIQLQKESIFNQEPSAFEQKLIHNIFVKTMDLNDNAFNVRKIPPGK